MSSFIWVVIFQVELWSQLSRDPTELTSKIQILCMFLTITNYTMYVFNYNQALRFYLCK